MRQLFLGMGIWYIVLINALSSLLNILGFVYDKKWWRWVSLVIGILCALIVLFIVIELSIEHQI